MRGMESLAAISAAPPALATDVVAAAVGEQFGLDGVYESLVSERDQNLRLSSSDGRRYVVKVVGTLEAEATTEFQLAMLNHLESCASVIAPQVVRTLSGASQGSIHAGDTTFRLRVVSWIDGEPLDSLTIDADTASRFGSALAGLDDALADFSHPGQSPVLSWDLQRAAELRPLFECIDDAAIRAAVMRAIDDFEQQVVPRIATLPTQVIHGDANPGNVLLAAGSIGFIDFGDSVRAPRIFDVAIAASYLRDNNEPLRLLRPFLAAYTQLLPLTPGETELLFHLVRARLATTITLLYWRLSDRPPGDEYRRKSLLQERSASHFLTALDHLGKDGFSI